MYYTCKILPLSDLSKINYYLTPGVFFNKDNANNVGNPKIFS